MRTGRPYGGPFAGARQHMLLILEVCEPKPAKGRRMLRCMCDCGNEVSLLPESWRRGAKSCGCARKIAARNRIREAPVHPAVTHGESYDRLYHVWRNMRQRCENPKHKAYPWYGAKGVRVCTEWQDWPTFRDWAHANGYLQGLVIDRENPDGNYEPSNCRWITQSENAKRVTRGKHASTT